MQLVTYEDDETGFKRQSYITDDMFPEQAYMGVPMNPPDLSQLDCENMLRELNDLLIARGLLTLKDIQGNNLLRSSIETIFYRKVYQLYKNNHPTGLKNGRTPQKKAS